MATKKSNPEYENNLAVYNEIAIYAQIAFESIECNVGTYRAEDVMKSLNTTRYGNYMAFSRDFNTMEPVTVKSGTFACQFPIGDVFRIMKQIATAYGIKSADRIMFTREAEAAETVVMFNIPKEARNIAKCAAKDEIRPAMNGVFVDTQRKTICATDGHLVQVVAVPGMMVSESADKNGYILPLSLFKSGKGTITISANNTATNGTCTAELIDADFPNYTSVIPAYSEIQKVDLTGAWKEFAQAMKEVVKFAPEHNCLVLISGKSGESTINLTTDNFYFNEEAKCTVTLPAPLTFDFSIGIKGDDITRINTSDALYIGKDASSGISFTANGVLTLVMPIDHDRWHVTFKAGDDPRPAMEIAHITQPEIVPEAIAAVEVETAPLTPDEITVGGMVAYTTPSGDTITCKLHGFSTNGRAIIIAKGHNRWRVPIECLSPTAETSYTFPAWLKTGTVISDSDHSFIITDVLRSKVVLHEIGGNLERIETIQNLFYYTVEERDIRISSLENGLPDWVRPGDTLQLFVEGSLLQIFTVKDVSGDNVTFIPDSHDIEVTWDKPFFKASEGFVARIAEYAQPQSTPHVTTDNTPTKPSSHHDRLRNQETRPRSLQSLQGRHSVPGHHPARRIPLHHRGRRLHANPRGHASRKDQRDTPCQGWQTPRILPARPAPIHGTRMLSLRPGTLSRAGKLPRPPTNKTPTGNKYDKSYRR